MNLSANFLQDSRNRAQLMTLLVMVAMGLLIHRLFVVQIYESNMYKESLRNQTTVSIILPPARGCVMDRNGVALAENRANYDIDVYLRELVGHYSRSHHGHLPRTNVWVGIGKNRRMQSQIDVAKIIDESGADLFKTLHVKPAFTDQEIQRHYHETPNVPFPIVRNMNFTTLSQFEEKNIKVPGIQETARPVRYYPFGALASHVLGYLGDVEEMTDEDYQPEFVGKGGVEKSFDTYLQGIPGGKILRKNNLGFVLDEEAVVQPRSGKFVYLTIDARIQYIVEKVMRRVGRGAALVLDPSNGDVLAMVSVPSFDPNDFVPKIENRKWRGFMRDPTKPLYNRAISSYAAGSIYKPIVALAALENKAIGFTTRTVINSPGAVWLANRWWKDWSPNGQGAISLRKGMAMSCNTFFYQLGAKTGIDSIVDMGKRFGLGEKLLNTDELEVLHGESTGVLPGPDWMKGKMDERIRRWKEALKTAGDKKLRRPATESWTLGHTINTSIGQGYVEVTPLQMAVLMCAIANGGHVYYPRLVVGIAEMKDGNLRALRDFPTRLRRELNVSDETLAAVRDALLAVVEEGTGRRAGVEGWKVAGKTGTAQFVTTLNGQKVKDLRAWFNGFAPYDSPRYVITVIVEGGAGGGSTAGPLVSEILAQIKEMEKNKGVDMVYLSPAVGHFAGVKEPDRSMDDVTPDQSLSIENMRAPRFPSQDEESGDSQENQND